MQLRKNESGLNDHVSVVKGIAILLMVLGHAGWPWWTHLLSMLRMPIFVIASGYCFKDYYLTHRLTFVRRRAKSLYWPFVKWSAIFLLLHNVFCRMGFYKPDVALYGWRDMVARVPHILAMHSPEPLVGGIWFITELLFGALLFIAFSPWIKRCPLAWVAGFAAVAVVLNVTGWHFRLRDVSLMSASYYTLGYWARGRTLDHRWPVVALLLVLVMASSLVVPGNFQRMNALWVVPNYATVMAGAWMVTAVAWHIVARGGRLSQALAYVGNHTLIILTLHFTAMRVVSWCLVHVMDLPAGHVGDHPVIGGLTWAWPLYFVAGVSLPLAFDYVDRKVRKQVGEMLKKDAKTA